MFCSKKMKVIAVIAFVLSQTLSVFAADPFAEYNVSDSDIAEYFFYEEDSAIELASVDGTLTEVKTVEDGEDLPYSEYRAFTNSDVSMVYYPSAFSTADTKEGRLELADQLFAFTTDPADDIAYDSKWYSFDADGAKYLLTLAKTAAEDPVYAYVIFDITNTDEVKLYYKKTLSQSGDPIVGKYKGEPVFVVVQEGELSPYVAEAYGFTETGIQKVSEDYYAFDWSSDSIIRAAKRANPNNYADDDYIETIGTITDKEDNTYLFVFDRHLNKGHTRATNSLLVFYGQRLLGYYPTINKIPVIASVEAKEGEEPSTEGSTILFWPKVSEEEGNAVDFADGLPRSIYVMEDSHNFVQY